MNEELEKLADLVAEKSLEIQKLRDTLDENCLQLDDKTEEFEEISKKYNELSFLMANQSENSEKISQ